ncbi:hypothetical protein [Streptomyces sp. NPDC049555]|uniref:hypothetical protein n=1 Tax=Streptomyces sp. NPDC049555 TaxID=3154930 RepID=UPI00342854F4
MTCHSEDVTTVVVPPSASVRAGNVPSFSSRYAVVRPIPKARVAATMLTNENKAAPE